jgi:3-oxoacyl-[acyl-carrier-protein] synthase-3
MSAAEALEAKLCEPRTVEVTGAAAVTVATGRDSPPEMAARAARVALARAGCGPAEVDLILHAHLYHQGNELWAAASYIQRVALGNSCPAIEVRQVSNGGMAALELATAYLRGRGGDETALLTAADRFSLPGFDRWRTDPGTVYADGGAAMVVSTRPGFARLRSLVQVTDPALEGMHRAGDAFGVAPVHPVVPLDLGGHKRTFAAQAGQSFIIARVAAGQREALTRALEDAKVDLSEIDWFVLPHFGRRRLEAGYVRPFGIDLDRSTWPWSRQVGHLGPGDQFAGLAHLAESGDLVAGQHCLLAGVGAGFTWSCAVVEILEEPVTGPWRRQGAPGGP